MHHGDITKTIYPREHLKSTMGADGQHAIDHLFEIWTNDPGIPEKTVMRSELLRLQTYSKWPQTACAHPTQLAKAGLYFLKPPDEVVCFSCQGKMSNWDYSEKPADVHRKRFSTCPFILGEDQTNIPLQPREDAEGIGAAGHQEHEPQSNNGGAPKAEENEAESSDDDFPEGLDPNPSLDRESNRIAQSSGASSVGCQETESGASPASQHSSQPTDVGAFCMPQAPPRQPVFQTQTASSGNGNQRMQYDTCNTQRQTVLQTQTASSGNGNQRTEFDTCITQRQDNVQRNQGVTQRDSMQASGIGSMISEQNRLRSLDDWPKRNLIPPKLMAEAGLFFVGPGDKVKCAFCNGAMMNWDEGDNPKEEHFRYFGDRCSFIRGEGATNVPITSGSSASSGRTERDSAKTCEMLGIVTQRPRHQNLARESDRLTTFGTWPHGKEQTPEVLSQAGFFYTGETDQVRCFFCDGGLRNWERGDEPWEEHARWFPRCGFLRQAKGSNYIHESNRGAASVDRQPNRDSQQAAGNGSTSSSGQFDRRLVSAQMATDKVKYALEMGFRRDVIQSVIETRLRTSGDAFPRAEELVEAVMAATEQNTENIPPVTNGNQGSSDKASPAGSTTEKDSVPQNGERTKEGGPPAGPGGKKKNRKKKKAKEEKQSTNHLEVVEKPAEDITESESRKANLLSENEKLKDQRLCKICLTDECSIVFLPCGHLVACQDCAPALRNCPICRALIRGTVKAFMA